MMGIIEPILKIFGIRIHYYEEKLFYEFHWYRRMTDITVKFYNRYRVYIYEYTPGFTNF